jgi:hypothetical protein
MATGPPFAGLTSGSGKSLQTSTESFEQILERKKALDEKSKSSTSKGSAKPSTKLE